MSVAPTLVWFRRDLRCHDQAALLAAAQQGPVIPVYILDDETPKHRKMGGASRWWLHYSLQSLDKDLQALGSKLILRRGNCVDILTDMAKTHGVKSIHALHHYEPWWRNCEKKLKAALPNECVLTLHDGNYLVPPGTITTQSGAPYKIYTPFMRALRQDMPPANFNKSLADLQAPVGEWPASDRLEDWKLLPTAPDWSTGFAENWKPGEASAHAKCERFIEDVRNYDVTRNMPSTEGCSYLSPHLHFGEISPASVWNQIEEATSHNEIFLNEIIWRDYATNIICQFPTYGSESYAERFAHMPWRDIAKPDVAEDLIRWQKGLTGYPIVDAGMRQLWQTGWMHNRVRMLAASFLIKHLLIDWRHGEQWFWDTLLDADYASNAVNWQWVAGSGADANMFSRMMAPLSQSEKFDAARYIRHFVPELAHLNDKSIHDPEEAGCKPKNYPAKIIVHKAARERALSAYQMTAH